jgi:hypothetical protein
MLHRNSTGLFTARSCLTVLKIPIRETTPLHWKLRPHDCRSSWSTSLPLFNWQTFPQIRLLSTCKIWGFHGIDYEEWRPLGYKNPVRTSQETHYVSTTESSQLMLCKIWGFHGSHYEECRLLRYKTPVRTSQETHYVSATESSQLILWKIWGFHGSEYEEWRLLGCYVMWLLQEPTFRRNLAPPSSG